MDLEKLPIEAIMNLALQMNYQEIMDLCKLVRYSLKFVEINIFG